MKVVIAGKTIEIDDATLSKALEEKQDTISVDSDFVIRTPQENEDFVSNLKDQQIKIGKEIGIKDFKKHIGIEVEGKDYDKVAEAYKNKILSESNISLDDKEKQWKKDKQTLVSSNQDLASKLQQKEAELVSIDKRYKIAGMIRNNIPKNLAFPEDDMTLILTNRFDFDIQDDGKFVAKDKATGTILQDSATLNPTPIDKVLGGFFEQNQMYLKGVEGGAEGTDSNSSGKTSIETYTKTLNEAGHATNSETFNAEMKKAIDAGTVSIDD